MSISEFQIQNVKFTDTLSRSSATTKGSILANDGTTGDFKLVSPTSDGQILTASSAATAGVIWGIGAQGTSAGFPIPNGITPNIGNTSYFLILTNNSAIPSIPVPTGRIIYFSMRPDNNGTGWWQGTSITITGGTVDYTFGYIEADDDATNTANFNAYSGGPHYQVDGLDIDANDFLTFFTTLDIAVTSGQQICVKIDNNITASGSGEAWTQQNAYVVLRF